MITSTDWISFWEKVIAPDTEFCVVHSDLTRICNGSDARFDIQEFNLAVENINRRGVTFMFPYFTYSFCQSGEEKRLRQKSESGALAELVWRRCSKSIRTECNIFSFCVVGSSSEIVMNAKPESCWGKGSVFEIIERYKTQYVSLGVDLETCTHYHRCEELAKVPYRKYKLFRGIVDDVEQTSTFFVRDEEIGPKNCYKKVARELTKCSSYREVQIGLGQARTVTLEDLKKTCCERLREDWGFLLENKKVVEKRLEEREMRKINGVYKIYIGCDGNASTICKGLEEAAHDAIRDYDVKINNAGYKQILLELNTCTKGDPLTESSLLICIPTFSHATTRLQLEAKSTEWIDGIKRFAGESSAKIVVLTAGVNAGDREWGRSAEELALVRLGNDLLKLGVKDVRDCYVVDIDVLTCRFEGRLSDHRRWHIGRYMYSYEYELYLGRMACKFACYFTGNTIRMIATDLDNTMWCGVLGEEGWEGLSCGGEYPGTVYRDYQLFLKNKVSEGVGLAVLSKNDEDLVKDAFARIGAMVVKCEDITLLYSNWDEKTVNMEKCLKASGLREESVLFVDDNQYEIEAMRNAYPGMLARRLLPGTEESLNAICDLPQLIDWNAVCGLDSKTKSFSLPSYIPEDNTNGKATDTSYMKQLGMEVGLIVMEDSMISRTEEIFRKTNQFNTANRRLARAELESIRSKEDSIVYAIWYRDKENGPEQVGCVIINRTDATTITDFALSCRVLGRGVEEFVLCEIQEMERCKQRGLTINLDVSPRNRPAQMFVEKVAPRKEGLGYLCTELEYKGAIKRFHYDV